MTDTAATDPKIIEHDQNEPQRQAEPETQLIDKMIAEPTQELSPLRQRAEMVPIKQTGVAPTTLGQQIDFAQYMARAREAVPKHLRDNPGACLALVDIASRYDLSAYMLAGKTYVQNDRLCFEAQAFNAFLHQSGLMKGDFLVTYEGEGDEMTCTITGILKSDGKPRSHTSEPLAKARPPMTSKTVDGVKIEYVKGSPLWIKKPKVQLFYDTSRDWIRMFAPTATIGIYTPEEMIENPIDGPSLYDGAFDGGQPDSSLHARLKGVNREEGHRPGHAETELNSVAAGGTTKLKAAPSQPEKAKDAPAADRPARVPRSARRAQRKAAAAPANADPAPANAEPQQEEKSAIQHKAELDQANAPTGKPKTNAEYWPYAIKWIDEPVPAGIDEANHATALEERWEAETHMRDDIVVPIKRRKEIEAHLIARCKALRGQE